MVKIILKVFLSLLLLTSMHANAEGVKELLHKALIEGSSEGVVSDSMLSMFRNSTKSNEPVYLKIKRVEKFTHNCGRIRMEARQGGVKDNKGKLIEVEQWIELNICPDGRPPMEKIRELEMKQQAIMDACVVSIKKLEQEKDSGKTNAILQGKGCQKEGMSHWRYSGDCAVLQMPKNMSTNTPITKSGDFQVKLQIPRQCLSKNNKWLGLFETQAKQQLSTKEVKW